MNTFNAFRPTLNDLEGRSLMSATFAATPAEPVGYGVTLSDVLVSSATPTAQTREHILLARQVGLATDGDAAAGPFRLFGDADGDATEGVFHKATLYGRKAGDANATETVPYEFEDVIISGVQVDTETARELGSRAAVGRR